MMLQSWSFMTFDNTETSKELEDLLEVNVECCTPSVLLCTLCAWLTAWPVLFVLIDDLRSRWSLPPLPTSRQSLKVRMAKMACNNLSILLLLTMWWLALEQVHSVHQKWGPVSKWRQSQGNVMSCRTVHGWADFCLDMNCEWAVK